MEFVAVQAGQLFIGSLISLITIDLIIIITGGIYRKQFETIPSKFFGLISGHLTQKVIERFGFGFISNTLFMIPVFALTLAWLYGMMSIAPELAQGLAGMAVGFHLTLLLLSLLKLSLVVSFEARFGKSFPSRVKKAVALFDK